MIDMAQRNVRFVIDQVLQKNTSEAGDVAKLKLVSESVYVNLMTPDSIRRYLNCELARDGRDHVLGIQGLIERARFYGENLLQKASSLNIDTQTLIVNINDGCDTCMDKILDSIEKSYSEQEEK